ncbi:MAG: right-handed parallel beta-helix repeat-containing protein [candidate division WOR-3 bacterium]
MPHLHLRDGFLRGRHLYLGTSGDDIGRFEHCLVEHNTAADSGGGIALVTWTNAGSKSRILHNTIRANMARNGGGMLLSQNQLSGLPTDTILSDNLLDSNSVSESPPGCETLFGGGIVAHSFSSFVKRNVILDNTPNGILVHLPDFYKVFVMGEDTSGLGFNVLLRNCRYALVARPYCSNPFSLEARGTYWGTVRTDSVWNLIFHPTASVGISPVAASGKWFQVSQSGACSTDIAVTGDLIIEPKAELSVLVHHEECPDSIGSSYIGFSTTPDCSLPGGSPDQCDLFVRGVLRAEGRASDTHKFRAYLPTGLFGGAPGDWYGVRVLPSGTIDMQNCLIADAYLAIDAVGKADSTVDVELQNTALIGNECGGVYAKHARTVVIDACDMAGGLTPGFGVRCESIGQYGAIKIMRSQFFDSADVWHEMIEISDCSPTQCSVASCRLRTGEHGPFCNVHGIVLHNVGGEPCVWNNEISNFQEAGILLVGSGDARLYHNGIWDTTNQAEPQQHTLYGVWCVEGSRPILRHNTIDSCTNGVGVDEYSLPDLGTLSDAGDNSILTGICYYVANSNSDTVRAICNWWGTPSPSSSKFAGPVAYDPWLRNPPPQDNGQSIVTTELAVTPELLAPRPNPFSNTTTIRYALSQAGPTQVKICDLTGRVVRTLVNQNQKPGRYSLTWNRTDDLGRKLAEGVYFVRLSAPGFEKTQKALVTQ